MRYDIFGRRILMDNLLDNILELQRRRVYVFGYAAFKNIIHRGLSCKGSLFEAK